MEPLCHITRIDQVSTDMIEVIDYQFKDRQDIDIAIEQPEFTSVCPMTGLPDFGRITVTYRPAAKVIELKSLKYYLLQYRNVGVFYEHLVNHLLNDLVRIARPKRMTIAGRFTARGGITTCVSAEYEENR